MGQINQAVTHGTDKSNFFRILLVSMGFFQSPRFFKFLNPKLYGKVEQRHLTRQTHQYGLLVIFVFIHVDMNKNNQRF